MTEINEFEFVCLRCLRDDETAEVAGPEKVIAECARCGTENWCLKIRGGKEAVEAVEGTSEEVAESIETPSGKSVPYIPLETDDEETESVEEVVSKAQKKREALIAKKRAELEALEKLE